jgi:hypothetical protein
MYLDAELAFALASAMIEQMADHGAFSGGIAVVVTVILFACAPARQPAPSARASQMPPSLGTVAGYIDPCYSIPPPIPPPYYSGTVVAVQGGTTVASETVGPGTGYRFSLVPGGYRLVAYNTPDQNNRWVDVTVVAGHITTRDIPNTCK